MGTMTLYPANALTVSDIRRMNVQLMEFSRFSNSKNNGIFAVMHPCAAPKLFWQIGQYTKALQCWWLVIKQCAFENAEPILKSIPWES